MIQSFHAHIYFRDGEERAKAEVLRNQIGERFLVQLGRWHDKLVAAFVPWLMLNRNGLAILLHPNTGRPRADHLVNAVWFGEILPIENVEALPEESDEDERAVPNTSPAGG